MAQDSPVLFALTTVGLALVGLAFDIWRHRRVDWIVLAATVVFIASFPIRIALVTTPGWIRTASWLATLVN